ncbi:MAG: aspartate carbamoyltransferase regulatory subunit [Thermoplasmatota archaeon]
MKEVRITPIKNGTVIDHIKPGMALKVLELLKINGDAKHGVSMAMYAVSKKQTLKDIVKVEGLELEPAVVNRLAILIPNATISIIRDFKVVEKYKVQLPQVVEGIARCENLNCISNQKEPIASKLERVSMNPPRYRCFYCGRDQENVQNNII